MYVIYVAGPYRAKNIHGVLENIRRAEKVAIEVWKNGFVAFCPHMNSAFFDGLVPDSDFLAGTLEMLKRCDGVVMVDGWEDSVGTREERIYCFNNHIPVFDNIYDLIGHTWQKSQ